MTAHMFQVWRAKTSGHLQTRPLTVKTRGGCLHIGSGDTSLIKIIVCECLALLFFVYYNLKIMLCLILFILLLLSSIRVPNRFRKDTKSFNILRTDFKIG